MSRFPSWMTGLAVLLSLVTSTACSVPATVVTAPSSRIMQANLVESPVPLHDSMRKLWEDHITFTRNYIVSGLAGLPDADAVATRLLRNQDEIGAAIAPYYGKEAGNKLASLLRDHILIAARIVAAARDNKSDVLAQEQTNWRTNARDIAVFLSQANPNWSEGTLQSMLLRHLDLTTQEVVSRLHKEWTADIEAYDKGHEHMLRFSDVLAEGIVKQFPDRFN